MMKDYAHLLADEPEWNERAAAISAQGARRERAAVGGGSGARRRRAACASRTTRPAT